MNNYSNTNNYWLNINNMSALLFPGQGSQIVGMGSEFYNNFKIVKKIFNEADQKLNFPISKMILEGPEDQLQLTQNTQPAILTVSYSIFKVLKKEFNFDFKTFKYFAGHSLGEYSALVCSDALNFNDALYLLNERGKAMQEAVPVGQGSMIAVLGAKINEVINLIKTRDSKNGICEIANDNAEGQVIISGDKESVEKFQVTLKEKKIKSIPLKVSAPFHCSLMKPAADIMKEKINNIKFNNPTIDIINNVTAKPENNAENIKKLLIEQIFSTVKWRESIINMSKANVMNYIEIGPGKVLTGMAKRTIKNVNCFSINSIADIEKLNNEFKK
jgi:[acyl-carrier-protein] S-malonyltransferase